VAQDETFLEESQGYSEAGRCKFAADKLSGLRKSTAERREFPRGIAECATFIPLYSRKEKAFSWQIWCCSLFEKSFVAEFYPAIM
jgi:hypothetical protein